MLLVQVLSQKVLWTERVLVAFPQEEKGATGAKEVKKSGIPIEIKPLGEDGPIRQIGFLKILVAQYISIQAIAISKTV